MPKESIGGPAEKDSLMNLVHDPWIPVLFGDGRDALVSLDTLFRDPGRIRDLSLTPPQRVAVMRLLTCIVQAALDGPADEKDWLNCLPRIVPRSLEYLEEHGGCFELYGERPFLQVESLGRIRNAAIDKLDFGLAAGHNATLFDHAAPSGSRRQSDAWRALMLLAYQCFSPGGLVGVTPWNGLETTKTSEHAPGVEGSALHTIVRGADLAATLHANLLTKEQVRELPNAIWGTPIWEINIDGPNSPEVETLVTSYLGRLVPMSRAILLEPDSDTFTLANGLAYPKLPEGREPTATVVIRGRGKQEKAGYVPVNPSRHPWRELASLLSLKTGGVSGGALALRHLRTTHSTILDIWTGGLAADKGKILDVGEWSFPFDTGLLEERALRIYQQGVDLAVRGEQSLFVAVKQYCAAMKSENTLSGAARARYWSTLDAQYKKLIEIAECEDNGLADGWEQIVARTMREAYAFTCAHVSARQIQAFAQGLRRLGLKKEKAGQ